ncbi:serine hydrolase [Pantoea sp. 18069]|uniref:serine hydrolase domain-containing protein n=1 Tax=Pantoea sp. 18069 TaxID=2681415 RepID=UPI001359C735|nr:serine hydrolase domain-containing protein [Pantoea sp. 18069]
MPAAQSLALIDSSGKPTVRGDAGPVPWWSFTKTVLAIAALRLVEDGMLCLDSPIAGERFNLRQLLRHEAGLADYGLIAQYQGDVAAGCTPWSVEQLLDRVDVRSARGAPGQAWVYSNVGYLYVGRQIAQAIGLSLADALKTCVFQPAGLTTARLARLPPDLADVNMGDVRHYHPGWVYHGLVTGTVLDAARLLAALVNGNLLQPQTLAQMCESRPLPEHRCALHPDPAYGLGLMLHAQDAAAHPLGHSGAGPGSRIAVYSRGGAVCALWAAESMQIDPTGEAFRILGNVKSQQVPGAA